MKKSLWKCQVFDLKEYKYRRFVKDMPKREALKIALLKTYQLQLEFEETESGAE